MSFEVVTSNERPDLAGAAASAFRERWPEFIFHDEIPPQYMPRVEAYFGHFDILLLSDDQVAAGGWGVPIVWDGTPAGLPSGYRSALVAAVEDHEHGRTPTAFSFMAAAVAQDFDKQGLAARVLEALASRATAAGLAHVVAPLRPTWKHRYPNDPAHVPLAPVPGCGSCEVWLGSLRCIIWKGAAGKSRAESPGGESAKQSLHRVARLTDGAAELVIEFLDQPLLFDGEQSRREQLLRHPALGLVQCFCLAAEIAVGGLGLACSVASRGGPGFLFKSA